MDWRLTSLSAGAPAVIAALGGGIAVASRYGPREMHSFDWFNGRDVTYACRAIHDGRSSAENAALAHAYVESDAWKTRSGHRAPGSLRGADLAEVSEAAAEIEADMHDLQRSLERDFGCRFEETA